MKTYIDDMLVKSIEVANHVEDLEEAFDALWCYHMKLNLTKHIFGIISNKFLRFLVTNQIIEVNPEKIKAILDMK